MVDQEKVMGLVERILWISRHLLKVIKELAQDYAFPGPRITVNGENRVFLIVKMLNRKMFNFVN